MIDLAVGVILGVVCGLYYKQSAVAGCRRLCFVAVERITIVLAMAGYCALAGGTEFCAKVVWVALLAGVSVLGARMCLLKALALGNTAITWTINGLAISIPVVASIVLWKETPSWWQWIGLALAPVGIVFMHQQSSAVDSEPIGSIESQERKQNYRMWVIFMLLAFVGDGVFVFSYKVVKEWGLTESGNIFILLYNAITFIFAGAMVIGKRTVPNGKEIRLAVPAGICIAGSAIFWIRAVFQLKGIVVFPVATGAGIVLMAVLSRLIWREKVTTWQGIGIGIAVAAIVLIAAGGSG